jgi:ArsR family transcriptional regulator
MHFPDKMNKILYLLSGIIISSRCKLSGLRGRRRNPVPSGATRRATHVARGFEAAPAALRSDAATVNPIVLYTNRLPDVMDSAVLLDLLGNENRRRILRLLARKPCYVTEISEYLGVSPKAVIDHLRKLEEAGLVESHTDDQRRKYFHISRNLRLEVNVSPYGFGTKSAYPASPSLDMAGRCRHVSLDAPEETDGDVRELAAAFDKLQTLEDELSLAQRWVYGRITEVLDHLNDHLGVDADSRFHAAVLAAVAADSRSVEDIASEVDASVDAVRNALGTLADRGLVTRDGDGWRIAAD